MKNQTRRAWLEFVLAAIAGLVAGWSVRRAIGEQDEDMHGWIVVLK